MARLSDTWDPLAREADMFSQQLASAYALMRGGNTVLIVVPPPYPKGAVINYFVRALNDTGWGHRIRVTPEAVHIEGSTGQMRVFDSLHPTFSRKDKRLLDYPGGIPTFVHPALEGSP